jgi:glycosyltransferase involved in cell wall biosynthesis
MNNPKVTVCIVTRNQHDFIEACVRSVAEQEVDAGLCILIGDDGSDDGTSEIVSQLAHEYPDRIEHIRREPRIGVFANMRDILTNVDSDFVARVDGDDYWLPGKLQRQLDYLLAHPDCAAVYTNAITLDEAGSRIGLFNDVGDERFDLPAMLRRGNFLNSSSMMFRAQGRHAWLDVEVPQIDYRIHLWQARNGWLGHIGEPLVAYRVKTRGSIVAGMNERVRELYWQAIQSVPRELVSDHDYAHGIADFLRRVFFRSLRTRDENLLWQWAQQVFAASPHSKLRTGMLTFASIMRIAGKELTSRFRKNADGRHIPVLYRR